MYEPPSVAPPSHIPQTQSVMNWKMITILGTALSICFLNAKDAEKRLTASDRIALKQKLRTAKKSQALQRLKDVSVKGENETDSFALFRTFMEIQSSDKWKADRNLLNPLMREKLVEVGERFPNQLSKSQRSDGCELVMMGKLFEKYLNDKDEAAACYLKVVKRFLDNDLPESTEDWENAVWRAETFEDLNADERYSFKRLLQIRRFEDVIENRIIGALDRKIVQTEMALQPEVARPEVDPSRTVPFEEIRKRHLQEGGQK